MNCPNCQGEKFLSGPSGGNSQNILCAQCGAEFCNMGPFGLEELPRDESRASLYGLGKLPVKGRRSMSNNETRPGTRYTGGQWVSDGETTFQIEDWCWADGGWWYEGWSAAHERCNASESTLSACAPVLTDEQESLRPGDEVESIEIPVGADGVPCGSGHKEFSGTRTIRTVILREARPPEVATDYYSPHSHAHNLRLASKGEPEQERPQPKFVVGQVVDTPDRTTRVCRSLFVDTPPAPIAPYWWYECEDTSGWPENRLRPHAMTVADVPDAVKVALLSGTPLRVVDAPVDHEGLPYSEKVGRGAADWCLRGKRVKPRRIIDLGDKSDRLVVVLADDEEVWPWNLELVPEPDAG